MEVSTVDIWSTNRNVVDKINFTWAIPNVSFLLPNFKLDSHPFHTGKSGREFEIKWYLNLSVSKKDDQFIFDMSLNLGDTSPSSLRIPSKYLLIILSPRHKQKYTWNLHEFSKNVPSVLATTTKVNDLQDVLRDDKLTIVCKLHFIIRLVSSYATKLFPSIECDMADNFSHLLRSQMLSDVKLVVGEQVFPAHKIVLATRSEVFAAMFQHKMEEAVSGQVSLNDVRPEVLEEMLAFIYTGKSPNIDKMADELLVVADKYALKKLHAMAEISLYRKLSEENAIETLILASLYNGMFLKKETIEYIHLHARVLIKTDGWKKNLMSRPDLVAELFEAQYTQ